jgi:hypothetical protein
MPRKKTHEEFVTELKEINPNLEVLGDYISYHTKIKLKCLIDDYIFETTPASVISSKSGCPVCSGNVVLKGINDLWTTHPEVAELLKNPGDGYRYSIGTHTCLEFKCPDCKAVKICKPVTFTRHGHFSCPKCGDGISFPEKFIYALLSQLNINFIYQLTSTTFEWCENYRYYFYLNDYNYIIETHGLQHYKNMGLFSKYSDDKVQINDENKRKLAKENGIKKYIVIDSRYSEMDYIKNSIINSELSNIFDLSNIDWVECLRYATKSIVKNICDDWNISKDINVLTEKYKLSETTIRRYLIKGTDIGLCNYIKKNMRKYSKVYCFSTKEIFPSKKYVEKEYKISIGNACTGTTKTAYGSKWAYVEDLPEDFIFEKSTITLKEYLKEYKKCKQ